MRTTIALDDALLARARAYSGLNETAAVVPEGLRH
jgi:Arc/MetJ family transcription regulator